MLRLIAIFLFLLSLLSASSNACRPMQYDTNSKELVTLKLANTYFQLPESAFENSFERTPRDANQLYISRLTVPSGHNLLVILITKEWAKREESKGRNWREFSDEILMAPGSGAIYEEALMYLKKISSKTPPSTWEKDFALANKFRIGQDPCNPSSSNITPMSKIEYSDSDILEGLQHRNQTIRAAAARRYEQDTSPSKETNDLLLHLARNDESEEVRFCVVKALGHLSKTTPELTTDIKEISEKDKSKQVRWVAKNILHPR
jgi:hypothetical protein